MEYLSDFWKAVKKVASYILVAAIATAITFTLTDKSQTKLTQLERILQERYIGEMDQSAMEDAAAKALVKAMGDRWSYYMTAEEYSSYQDRKSNSYVGIGVTVQLREDQTGFDILQVEPTGSAVEAGVQPGDILVEVEGQDAVSLGLDAVGELIRGEEGTTVTIAVLRDGEKMSFTIPRKAIQNVVASSEMLPNHIGLVTIANFNNHCAEQSIAAVEKLLEQGAQTLIFDVRNNPGGYVDEMVELLDYLLPEGILFQSVEYNGFGSVENSDENCVDLPMAVLVNGESYSAAEFFAAALEEYEWAIVVGEPTCGKGYYQKVQQLKDGSAVNLSVGKYYTPKGVSLTEVGGLKPKVAVTVDEQTAADIYAGILTPEEDPQIQAAVAALVQE